MKISWVTIDRICEEQRAPGSGGTARGRTGDPDRPLRSSAAGLSDAQLLAKLAGFGLDLDRDGLEQRCAAAVSAEEVARSLIDGGGARSRRDGTQADWIWICVVTLWQRWWPQRVCLELLDDKVQDGYALLGSDDVAAARTWLGAWSDVLRLCDATGIRSIEAFDERIPLTQSLYNWIQDLEDSLWNAGLRDHELLRARVAVYQEALRRFPHEDRLLVEGWRRAVAVTRFELGEVAEAEELFRTWLGADPRWGFGWVAWAVCHLSPAVRTGPRDLVEAERLLREGYSTPGVRDRDALADWLKVLYDQTGRSAEARSFGREAKELRRRAGTSRHTTEALGVTERFELEDDGEAPVLRHRTTLTFGEQGLPLDQLPAVLDMMRSPTAPAASRPVPKVGRNAPCPCGSGRKYKRCCGPGAAAPGASGAR
jgi:tetratricopeptide (TPR) repeat protein